MKCALIAACAEAFVPLRVSTVAGPAGPAAPLAPFAPVLPFGPVGPTKGGVGAGSGMLSIVTDCGEVVVTLPAASATRAVRAWVPSDSNAVLMLKVAACEEGQA